MITCTIATQTPYGDVEKLLRTELARTHPRSTVRLEKEKKHAVVHIDADDISALRAAFNGITTIISIYEKTHDIARSA